MKAVAIAVCALLMGVVAMGSAKVYYRSDFEGDAVGSTPSAWTRVFEGATTASVIADPADAGNRVLSSSDLAHDKSRHDVGGSIYSVGDASWTDYIVEYDIYFPADFYMGVLFRIQSGTAFYLFDRRSAGEAGNFDFWMHADGSWTGVQRAGKFTAEPQKWYRFRLSVMGDSFEAYAKEKGASQSFEQIGPFLSGTNASYETGGFGLYGLVYVDNVVIGDTPDDLLPTPVEPRGRLATTWATLKR